MEAPVELSSRLIGSIFVEKGLITQEQLEAALKLQQETGERLGEIVVGEFGVPRLELASVLAEQWAEYERVQTEAQPAARTQPPAAAPLPLIEPLAGEPLLRKPIGEIFVERGFVTDSELQSAVELQHKTGQRIGEVLVEQGALSRLDLASALAEQWANHQKPAPAVSDGQGVAPSVSAAVPASDEATAGLVSRVSDLEHVLASVVGKAELDALAGELRESLAALEHRISEGVALDEERAMASIISKIDAMRTVIDEPLQRLAALEQRVPDSEALGELDARVRTELDELVARIDTITTGHDAGDDLGDVRETLARLSERQTPTSEAFDSLKHRVEELATTLSEPQQPAFDPDVSDKLDAVAGQVEAAQTGLAFLSSRLEELALLSVRVDEVAAQVPGADVVEDLRRSLAELAEQAAAREGQPNHSDQIAALGARLDQVSARLGDLGEQVDAVPPPADLQTEIKMLSDRLDELASAGPPAEIVTLGVRLEELERRGENVGELRDTVASIAGGLEERRRSVDPLLDDLRVRLDEVASRIDGVESVDLRSGLDDLQRRFADLEGLLRAVPIEDVDARVSALEREAPGLADIRRAMDELADGAHDAGAALDARLSDVEGRLSASAAFGDSLRELQERVADLGEHDDDARLADIERRLEELRASLQDSAPASIVEGVRAVGERVRELHERVESAVASREDLDRLAGDLAQTSEVSKEEIRAAKQRFADSGEVAALRGRVGELEESLASTPGAGELSERLGEIERRLANTAGVDAVRAELRSAAEASAVERESLERSLMNRIHEMVGVTGPVVDELTVLSRRLDEVASQGTEDAEARSALDDLRGRVEVAMAAAGEIDALGHRLEALEGARPHDLDLMARIDAVEQALSRVAAVDQRIDDLHEETQSAVRDRIDVVGTAAAAEADALRLQIDELRLATGEREDALVHRLEEVAAASDFGEVRARLDGLESRLDGVVSREEVQSLVVDLHARFEEAQRSVDEARAQVSEEASAQLDQRLHLVQQELDGREGRLDERITAHAADLAAIRGELTSLAGVASGQDDWRAHVEESLSARVGEIELSISSEAAGARAAVESTVADARHELDGIAARLDELVAGRADDVEGARIADVELAARIDDVALRLAEGTATAESTLRKNLEEIAARLVAAEALGENTRAAASEEVERVVASFGWRLERIEESLAADDRSGVQGSLERLERRLDAQAAQADEQVRVTEKALRKGLASLGAQLAETHSTYSEAGDALRSSIERLGAAVSDADRRIAGRDGHDPAPPAVAKEFVAFAPTEEGYRLVVVEGAPPEVGDELEVAEVSGRLVVTRVGASPLPLDARPCAYLDRASLGRVAD